mmetsp:Transcript_9526/g.21186  ORF Transcript_9526/g.21186 Transcript_9526/m.21186 type:complete len:214 (+) Transcript_9526:1973-2614(+)
MLGRLPLPPAARMEGAEDDLLSNCRVQGVLEASSFSPCAWPWEASSRAFPITAVSACCCSIAGPLVGNCPRGAAAAATSSLSAADCSGVRTSTITGIAQAERRSRGAGDGDAEGKGKEKAELRRALEGHAQGAPDRGCQAFSAHGSSCDLGTTCTGTCTGMGMGTGTCTAARARSGVRSNRRTWGVISLRRAATGTLGRGSSQASSSEIRQDL